MNPTTELMDKIIRLRQVRAGLLGLWIISAIVVLGISLQPSPVRDLQKENGLLKRYALRLEKQNNMKDQAFMKLVSRVQQR